MEMFHALPRAGGLLDQPAGLLNKIRHVADVDWAVREYNANAHKPGQGGQWQHDHPEIVKIFKYVEQLRRAKPQDR